MFKKKDTKLLVENWRQFINEEKEVRPSIKDYIEAGLIYKKYNLLHLTTTFKAYGEHVDYLISDKGVPRETLEMFVEDLIDKKIPVHNLVDPDPFVLKVIKRYVEALGIKDNQNYLNFLNNPALERPERSEPNLLDRIEQIGKNIEAEKEAKRRKDFLDKYPNVPEIVVLRIEDLIEKNELIDLWYKKYNLNDFYQEWSDQEWSVNFYNFLKNCLAVDLKEMFSDDYDLTIRYYKRIDNIMRDCYNTVSVLDYEFDKTAKQFLLDFLNYIYSFKNN